MKKDINKFIDWLIKAKILKNDDLKYYLDDYLKEKNKAQINKHRTTRINNV